jgi:hypothetical protein
MRKEPCRRRIPKCLSLASTYLFHRPSTQHSPHLVTLVMAPAIVATPTEPPGPHPSYIQVAKPFIFEQKVQSQIIATGANPAREDAYRLQGVQWIDEVRRALQLSVLDISSVCAGLLSDVQLVRYEPSIQLPFTITSFVWSTRTRNINMRTPQQQRCSQLARSRIP